jgi:hypothetical protein
MQGHNYKAQSGLGYIYIILLYSFYVFLFIISPSHVRLEKQELLETATKRRNQREVPLKAVSQFLL